ncbi:PsbB mRNA maturation factor Mbb1, chloroplastic [Porphyridium purpureum]|uniref:PsbB mRNA maturation factor Mbb1, chloroplastic n=1 Tax=Porphyridium purpureum TaxID=35688 RepID=A0A5J4YQR2_PORPP|nr:PsbB mRNA maturation factor Mbb1, chloroplastic [Porphyridium purpureum]|eukprot:POR9366..scf236_6
MEGGRGADAGLAVPAFHPGHGHVVRSHMRSVQQCRRVERNALAILCASSAYPTCRLRRGSDAPVCARMIRIRSMHHVSWCSGRQERSTHKSTCCHAALESELDSVQPDISDAQKRAVVDLFRRAKKLESENQCAAAQALYEEGLAIDRRDGHTWLALGQLIARKDSTRAREIFEEALRHCHDNVFLLQAFAVFESKNGNVSRARTLFTKANELDPANPYVFQAWGLLEQRAGNRRAAREMYSRCVSIRPQSQVCLAWGTLESREGNVERARELFRLALRIAPGTRGHRNVTRRANTSTSGSAASGGASTSSSPAKAPHDRKLGKYIDTQCRVLCAWAELEERMGDHKEALQLLNRALELQKDDPETIMVLARLQSRTSASSMQPALLTLRNALHLDDKLPRNVINGWANLELKAGNAYKALEILNAGKVHYPSDPCIFMTLGTVHESCSQFEQARDWYARSVDAEARAPTLVAWALLEERCGHFDLARSLFQRALRVDPLHGQAYNAYAMMEQRLNDQERALAVYQHGLDSGVCSVSLYHGASQLHKARGEYDQARALLRQGVLLTRESTVYLWHSWGMLEIRLNNVSEARRIGELAMKRYPNDSRVLLVAALAYSACSAEYVAEVDRARELFRKAVLADPMHAHAWQVWGVFEASRNCLDAARALFKRGLRLSPTHGALWQAWAVLEMRCGDLTKSRSLFERGTTACPNHVHLFQAWACMEVRANDPARARDLLDAALKICRTHGPVWTAYGLLEARYGTMARARFCFQEGARVDPNHGPVYRTWAQTEADAKDFQRARELFKRGLELAPHYAPMYHRYAEMEAMLGNVAALADLQERAKVYFPSASQSPMHQDFSVSEFDGLDASDDEEQYLKRETEMERAIRGAQDLTASLAPASEVVL